MKQLYILFNYYEWHDGNSIDYYSTIETIGTKKDIIRFVFAHWDDLVTHAPPLDYSDHPRKWEFISELFDFPKWNDCTDVEIGEFAVVSLKKYNPLTDKFVLIYNDNIQYFKNIRKAVHIFNSICNGKNNSDKIDLSTTQFNPCQSQQTRNVKYEQDSNIDPTDYAEFSDLDDFDKWFDYNDELNDNKSDVNKPDDNEPFDNKSYDNEPVDNKSDNDKSDDNEPDYNEPDDNKSHDNKPDDSESDDDKSDDSESVSHSLCLYDIRDWQHICIIGSATIEE